MDDSAPGEPWVCPTCRTQNYGAHPTCLVCGANKPVISQATTTQPPDGQSSRPGMAAPSVGTRTAQPVSLPSQARAPAEASQPASAPPETLTQARPSRAETVNEPALMPVKPQTSTSSPTRKSPVREPGKGRRGNCFVTACGIIVLLAVFSLVGIYFGRDWLLAQVPAASRLRELLDYPGPAATMEAPVVEEPTFPTATWKVSLEQPTLQALPTVQYLPVASYSGTSFSYDSRLAWQVIGLTQAAVGEESMMADPEHTLFDFEGYPNEEISSYSPEIHVYPIADYQAINPDAAAQIESLRQVISSRPAVLNAPLPYLPVVFAGQLIIARIEFIEFQNGEGIRYLTQFGQDIYPINNANLIYTFQGLTTDGEYYISASFPIQSSYLPANGSEVEYDYQEFSDAFPAYAVETTQLLEQENASSFVPDMDLLDAMMGTLLIAP